MFRNIFRAYLGVLSFIVIPFSLLAQTTHDVTVGDNFFSPSNLTIQMGDTVRWTNAGGGVPHDVTESDFAWASETASSFVFTRTFNSIEEVSYFCTIHPGPMQGSISVVMAVVATRPTWR